MKFKPKEYWTPITITSKHYISSLSSPGLRACSTFPTFHLPHRSQCQGSPEREILGTQLKLMAKRLWYIIMAFSHFGDRLCAFIVVYHPLLVVTRLDGYQTVFVALLFFYHYKTHRIFLAFQQDDIRYSSLYMRIWNEGATILLFSIVFLVILKSSFHWIFGVLSLVGLAVMLMLGIKLYQKVRKD